MIIEILTHTPLWVYGLFVGLIFVGWQQTRERHVKQSTLLILPLGMLALSFFGATSSFGYSLTIMLLWLAGVLSSTIIGLLLFSAPSASYQAQNASFKVPGSWWPMIFIMAIFFTKYTVGVLTSIKPELFANAALVLSLAAFYGILSGTFIARAIRVLKVRSS
ncbi:DUF6622 family protein [Pseudoalteromonas gelatinilytica]|uniref:DUF1453 domain-containing protein n=1 Tax=Pseudoalteromonas gelatinilytica TaxID=1703256 RepID=A0ABQ1TAA0_9GAMM|nr:DUF6622 family protein [Pseudoalteromonas profundi]GGE85773.1 hypothetical protein GCM10008027_08340 [Pseudoalteromonas profundi]